MPEGEGESEWGLCGPVANVSLYQDIDSGGCLEENRRSRVCWVRKSTVPRRVRSDSWWRAGQQGLLTNPRRSVNGTESPVMQNTLRTSAGFSFALKHWCFCANKNGPLFSTDSLPKPRYPVCRPRTHHSVPLPIPGSPEFLLFLLCPFTSACLSGTFPSHLFLQMTFSLSYKILHDCCHSRNWLDLLWLIHIATINIVSYMLSCIHNCWIFFALVGVSTSEIIIPFVEYR